MKTGYCEENENDKKFYVYCYHNHLSEKEKEKDEIIKIEIYTNEHSCALIAIITQNLQHTMANGP